MDEIMSPQVYCCVHGCESKISYRTFNKYKLHSFPPKSRTIEGKKIFFQWIHAIKLPTKYTNEMRVCSLHFGDDDFITEDGKKELKSCAVPSKNLPKLWRNKFYPRNYGRLVKFLEYRGIGRLRLCLQAKLVKRLKEKTASINEQRKKAKELIEQVKKEGGLELIKAFSLSTGSSTPHHEHEDLHSDICIKEEPLSDQEEMGNVDMDQNDSNQGENNQGDSVEEMLARMNEDTTPLNNNSKIIPDLSYDDDDDDYENDACNVCGSDACKGHSGLQFDCNFCSKSFKTFRQLNAHNLSHFEYSRGREVEGGRTKCKVCGEVLENVRLSEHMMRHAECNEQVCMLCEKVFKSRPALMQHVNSEHTLEKAERCKLCKKMCSSKEELDSHVRNHKVMKKEYACRECGLTFRNKSGCWAHLNNHSRERMRPGFECELCGRILSTRATLKEHMFIHSGEKPFECLLCGKKIRHRANFIIHVQSHSLSGTGGYSCSSCGACYQRKSELKAHSLTAHPDEVVSYPCIICGTSFRTETGFMKHAVSHNASLDDEP